jgi:signal transduction histidine kinase
MDAWRDPRSAFRHSWQRHAGAIAVVAAAGAMRVWPLQALGARLAWLTFYPAVAVAALYGGLSAGLLGTCLSCLTVLFLLPALVNQPFIRDSADWLGMVVFSVTCVMISGIAEAMLRANARAKRASAQAEAAMRELESFSYSVAHDLRAPLRSMDGFSQALLQDYSPKLDDQGKDYLQRVRASAQRMGGLIDDMLRLSRVTRMAMRRRRVDLSELARTVVAELRAADPKRHVEVDVADGMEVEGDPDLLGIALRNLVGNAWKFTSGEPTARIEIGAASHAGEQDCFVRDNGAGFDMAYAGKLFGPFQRLHADSEFTGSGIGLATVQRIISRHGGRVWAEAAVGRGATFFFTLQ